MSHVRFATTQAVFDAFPEMVDKISVKPTDQSPIHFLRDLIANDKIADAVTFCAYLLPRREAVWWACGSVRTLLPDIPQARAGGLLAAEAWVSQSDDDHRRAALELGTNGDTKDPATWLALAAGWAGGLLVSNPKSQVPMPQYMTPRAVRIAIVTSSTGLPKDERITRLKACVQEGINLAEQ